MEVYRMKQKTRKHIGDIISVGLFFISYVLFIIALFLQNETMIGISSALIFLSLLVAIIKILTKKTKFNILEIIELLIDFISTIAFVIVFIYSVTDDGLKDVVIPIASSVIGGLLTLSGVALTIKYGRIEKEEEEIKKAKPIVFPISVVTWKSIDETRRTKVFVEVDEENSYFKAAKKSKKTYLIDYFLLANSDASMCSLYGININDKIIKFKYEQILSKDSNNCIFLGSDGFEFTFNKKIDKVSLLICDMLDNVYEAVIRFEISDKRIQFNSCLETKIYGKFNK